MRHASIHKKARFIDQFVDYYKKARGRSSFPHKETRHLVRFLFPGSLYSGRGAFKTVHKISSNAKDLVLKTSHFKNITRDFRISKKVPNRYFAKIYWKTRYCFLQKHGKSCAIPPKIFLKLKQIGKKYGLTDIRRDNIRKIDGVFKIVDANLRKKRKRN